MTEGKLNKLADRKNV